MTDGWSVSNIWKDAVRGESRELKVRDNIWASELGGSFIDRYLKMKATPYSNTISDETYGKFFMGVNIEYIIKRVFLLAGILQQEEGYSEHQYQRLLRVSGRFDMLVGGNPDWERARASINDSNVLFPREKQVALSIIDTFQAGLPDYLEEYIVEVKTAGVRVFDRYAQTEAPNLHHALQCYHYLVSNGIKQGRIWYLCREDGRMLEFPIYLGGKFESQYKSDIVKMTEILARDSQPNPEPLVSFVPEVGKFQKNWRVEYSPYLTLVYGYEKASDYREAWEKRVGKWNRVLGRCVKGDKMTAKNIDVIADAKTMFPNWEEIVVTASKVGVTPEEEGGEE